MLSEKHHTKGCKCSFHPYVQVAMSVPCCNISATLLGFEAKPSEPLVFRLLCAVLGAIVGTGKLTPLARCTLS